MKKFLPFVFVLFVFISGIVAGVMARGSAIHVYQQAQSKVQEYENLLIQAKNQNQEKEDDILYQVTGLDTSRKDRDDDIIEDLLSDVMSWETGEEYQQKRESLMQDYDLTENSRFLKTFMPELVVVTDQAGNSYNRIDTYGLHISFVNVDTYLTNVGDDGTYSYMGFVTWRTSDDLGNEIEHTDVVTCDVSENGDVLTLNGYSVSE